jgi:hypothetical protein
MQTELLEMNYESSMNEYSRKLTKSHRPKIYLVYMIEIQLTGRDIKIMN